MPDLTGKVAIVTGAGRGVGREHALALARAGAKLVVNDLGGSLAGEGNDLTTAQQVARFPSGAAPAGLMAGVQAAGGRSLRAQ